MTRSSSVDAAVFRGTCGYPCEEDQELALICHCTCAESIAAVHAYQTSQQVTTSLRSKLCCGSEYNSNLTAVMSGLPSSQHAQDLTELCSSKYGIITRALDDSRCVELSEGGTRHADSRRLVKSSSEEKNLSDATAAAKKNETTKKVSRVLDRNTCQEDSNDEEATVDEENAVENYDDQDCQARDANISRFKLLLNSIIRSHL